MMQLIGTGEYLVHTCLVEMQGIDIVVHLSVTESSCCVKVTERGSEFLSRVRDHL
jgi:hypothetical protein